MSIYIFCLYEHLELGYVGNQGYQIKWKYDLLKRAAEANFRLRPRPL